MDLVLYDGVCGLCNRLVRFILRHDPAGRFRFASLQSALADSLVRKHGVRAADLDTIYLVRSYGEPSEDVVDRGRAILHVLERLGGVFSLAMIFRILPRSWLNAAYRFVAKRRYRWFGRYDTCPLPTPAERARFLDVVIR